MTHTPHGRTSRLRILALTTAAVLAASMALAGCSDESSGATDSGTAAPAGQSNGQVADQSAEQPAEQPDAAEQSPGQSTEQAADDDDSVSDDGDTDGDDDMDEYIANDDTLSFTLIDGLCDALDNLSANRTKLLAGGPDEFNAELVDEIFGPIDPHIAEIANTDLRESLQIMSDAAHSAVAAGDSMIVGYDGVMTAQAKVSGYSSACP